MIALLICAVALVAKVASEGCLFEYSGVNGVLHWGNTYRQCLGKHQSPININTKHVTHVTLSPIKMNGFQVASGASLKNNGHTAMLTTDCATKPTISGGPLNNGVYKFAQLHFHWGDCDSCGGENEIDGKTNPLEMHMVFFKTDYEDVDSALARPDGLCVLGCLFEIEKKNNDKFSDIVTALPKVTQPHTVANVSSPITLIQLLPPDLSSYFTYNGSLTTPPCSESVTWIEFDKTVKISDAQLQAFRSLTDSKGIRLVNNFRAIQPLGDRKVFYHKYNDKPSNLNMMMSGFYRKRGKSFRN